MAKITVEIEDDLDEIVRGIQEEIKQHFIDYLKEHPDIKDFEDYYQDVGCDSVHEISDSSTPIYSSHIDGLYYLYSDEFEEAYKNSGIGTRDEDNHRQVTICIYLEDKGLEYQHEIAEKFTDWLIEKDAADDIGAFIESLEN